MHSSEMRFKKLSMTILMHKEESEKSGLGFVDKEDEKELKVNISKAEVDNLIKEYKKIKKKEKNLI